MREPVVRKLSVAEGECWSGAGLLRASASLTTVRLAGVRRAGRRQAWWLTAKWRWTTVWTVEMDNCVDIAHGDEVG